MKTVLAVKKTGTKILNAN